MTTAHVVPVDDLIEHEHSDECVCGPTVEPVKTPAGAVNWLVIHNSLDGREGTNGQEESS